MSNGNTLRFDDARRELNAALMGLSRACRTNPKGEETDKILCEALAATLPAFPADEMTLRDLIVRVRSEKDRIAPNCAYCASPCGATAEYDVEELLKTSMPNRGLKLMLLGLLRALAATVSAPNCRGGKDTASYVTDTLRDLADDWDTDGLVGLIMRTSEHTDVLAG